ncbi:hypothetical protein RPB_3904 [Rhodopseudomonas palustris HaA2]|uniref:Uncharacterized protein n=1 Tax=Rhodopseudomonas palustris (strain HaA2) TaxID=316058 RepID=Q2IT63_RHOP2|nr:hypothetical protein [Rhodopseudomonas palustris]ABD08597.1 hypothetical protein RPB_3904 [Rhodopseudomonas palustris HaA2]
MSEFATLSLTRTVIDAAADRARQQGLTTEDYVMQVLLRELEIGPNELILLAYDAARPGSGFVLDRDSDESDDDYQARSSTLDRLFP